MRGFLLSLDAMVAISLMLLVAIFLSGLSLTYASPELGYQRLYLAGKDLLVVMDNVEVEDLQEFETIRYYTDVGLLTEVDDERTLLDVIGSLWASDNVTEAANITEDIFGTLLGNTQFGYELSIDGMPIFNNGVSQDRYVSKFSNIVSGYGVGGPVEGYVSRVFIKKANKVGSNFIYFGGYEGDGNISKVFDLPEYDQIIDVYIEMDVVENFTLYVNGNYSGLYENNSASNLTADKWTMDSAYYGNFVSNASNLIWLNFTINQSRYIGGGYIKIRYNTSELITVEETAYGGNATDKYRFPGIEGIINLFTSFYVPGNLTNISGYVHYHSSYPVFMTVGNVTIFERNDTTEQLIYLGPENFSAYNFSNISLVTIPLRFGTRSLEHEGEGQGIDAVIITDRTGSMDNCDVSSASGPCDCNAPAPCDRDRIKVALDADRAFISAMMDTPRTKVAMIGYGERAGPTCSFHDFSDNNQSLQNRTDTYYYNNQLQDCGYTCISCGITGATELITENEFLYNLHNVSDINSTPMHVGDTGDVVAVNETLTVDIDSDKFIKSRLTFLSNTIHLDEANYRSCIFFNGMYIGRVCQSNEIGGSGWHTCTYPIKKDWLIDGDNELSVTAGNTTGCFEQDTLNPADQDDWDIIDAKLKVWELRNDQPNITSYVDANEYVINRKAEYLNYSDLWDLDVDKPDPVDFNSGVNRTGDTYTLGGFSDDDGWDRDPTDNSGPFGYDDEMDYNYEENRRLEFDTRTGTYNRNECNNDDCSGAYGIQVNITQQIYDQILLGNSYYISFWYEWDGNDNPFESTDEIWIKSRWESPYSGTHYLGTELSNADGDSTLEIDSRTNPDSDFAGFYRQDITSWIEGIGYYYFEIGGRLQANSNNEWGDFRFDDISGGILNTTAGQTNNELNITFDVNTTDIKSAYLTFEAADIDPRYYDCVYMNGHHIGRLGYQKFPEQGGWHEVLFDVPVAWMDFGSNTFTFLGGTDRGCWRTGTDNDTWKIRNINLTVRQSPERYMYTRFKSMLVMSDGGANTRIGDCHGCGGGADTEAVVAACEAHDRFNISIFSVAFGAGASENTMQSIAFCDDTNTSHNFFTGNDADDLVDIYQLIAANMINLSFLAQALNITGNVTFNNTLYNDSYLEFDYTSTTQPPEFGDVTLTFEMPRLGNSTGSDIITDNVTGTKEGWYFVPNDTEVIDAKITSYSSDLWTDRLYVKNESDPIWNLIYWLGNYSQEYIEVGDPFVVQIPPHYIGVGENNSVKIGTDIAPLNGSGGSPDSRVIYTIKIKNINLQSYSDVFPRAEGSNVTVYYDYDGDNVQDGSALVTVGNGNDKFDPKNDSIDDGFMRLLDSLNFLFDANEGTYGDGTVLDPFDGVNTTNPIDLQLTSDVEFQTSSISGIPSLWGPAELEIMVWI